MEDQWNGERTIHLRRQFVRKCLIRDWMPEQAAASFGVNAKIGSK